jgi:hypothetical protein
MFNTEGLRRKFHLAHAIFTTAFGSLAHQPPLFERYTLLRHKQVVECLNLA